MSRKNFLNNHSKSIDLVVSLILEDLGKKERLKWRRVEG